MSAREEEDGFCKRCKKRPIEIIDDWRSDFCGSCNDRLIERDQERREFDHYHPHEISAKSRSAT